MKKLCILIGIVLMVSGLGLVANATDADISCTFDPSTSMSANLWNDTFAYGSLNADATGTEPSQLNNTGDVSIDATIKEQSGAADMSHVTSFTATKDEYKIEFNTTGAYADLPSGGTSLVDALVPSSNTPFNVKLTMDTLFSEDWTQQSITVRVTYVVNVP